jgi:large conductance mechanosensitive channel
MFKEFKEFISKGNVMDMAIGVIIANAFAAIVAAFTSSFIQPILALIGGAEVHGTIPLGKTGQYIDYGSFITAVINFLIVAFILFIMIKAVNIASRRSKERLEKLSAKIPKKGKKAATEEAEAEPETKLCPFCYTEIAFKATRCPHCTSELKDEIKK